MNYIILFISEEFQVKIAYIINELIQKKKKKWEIFNADIFNYYVSKTLLFFFLNIWNVFLLSLGISNDPFL